MVPDNIIPELFFWAFSNPLSVKYFSMNKHINNLKNTPSLYLLSFPSPSHVESLPTPCLIYSFELELHKTPDPVFTDTIAKPYLTHSELANYI